MSSEILYSGNIWLEINRLDSKKNEKSNIKIPINNLITFDLVAFILSINISNNHVRI